MRRVAVLYLFSLVAAPASAQTIDTVYVALRAAQRAGATNVAAPAGGR